VVSRQKECEVRGVGSRTDPAPISREKVGGAEVGLELDVEEGDVIAASLAVAGRDQLVTIGDGADREHFDVLSNDEAVTWKAGLFEGDLERGQFLNVVAVIDRDLIDQLVELGIGSTSGADPIVYSVAARQPAGLSRSRASGGQRISPLLKRPIGRWIRTTAACWSSSTTMPWMPCR
jgi:hypothetical protein